MTLWFVLAILAEPRAQFPAPMPSNSHLSVTSVLGNLTPSTGLGKELHLCELNGHKLKHMHIHLIKIILKIFFKCADGYVIFKSMCSISEAFIPVFN